MLFRSQIEKPKAENPKKENSLFNGQINGILRLKNVEVWIPDNPTSKNSDIVKFRLTCDGRFVNKILENNTTSRSGEANITSLSLIFASIDKTNPILDNFDVKTKYEEISGKEHNIELYVKPNKIKVTCNQLRMCQKFAYKVLNEIQSIDLPFSIYT